MRIIYIYIYIYIGRQLCVIGRYLSVQYIYIKYIIIFRHLCSIYESGIYNYNYVYHKYVHVLFRIQLIV